MLRKRLLMRCGPIGVRRIKKSLQKDAELKTVHYFCAPRSGWIGLFNFLKLASEAGLGCFFIPGTEMLRERLLIRCGPIGVRRIKKSLQKDAELKTAHYFCTRLKIVQSGR